MADNKKDALEMSPIHSKLDTKDDTRVSINDSLESSPRIEASASSASSDRPIRLIVVETMNDDNSSVTLSKNKMAEFTFVGYEIALLSGKNGKQTVCTVKSDDTCRDHEIRMNRIVRNNLDVCVFDPVSIQSCSDIEVGLQVKISPIGDTIQGLTKNVSAAYLKPYFGKIKRPIHKGDTFLVRGGMRAVQFKVIDTYSKQYIIVGPNTKLIYDDNAMEQHQEKQLNVIGYEDIGGCSEELHKLKRISQYLLRNPSWLENMNIKPSNRILMGGPKGTGKKLIARAIATENEAFLVLLNGYEILSLSTHEAKNKLQNAFEEAKEKAPAVIFINEVDIIAPFKNISEHEKVIFAKLITLINEISECTNVIVLAATNKLPKLINLELRVAGRLDHEIMFSYPNVADRLEILQILTRNINLSDVSLEKIAAKKHGHTAGQLASLCKEVSLKAIQKMADNLEADLSDAVVLTSISITMEEFEETMRKSPTPSIASSALTLPNDTVFDRFLERIWYNRVWRIMLCFVVPCNFLLFVYMLIYYSVQFYNWVFQKKE